MMENKVYSKNTVVLCAVWLAVVATAAFFSMNAFTRPVFGNDSRWQLSFAVLMGCLLVSAAVKKPAVTLAVSVAAAVGMYFYTPYYGALFFPVALQAALWEAARDETTSGRTVFAVGLLLVPASIPLRVRLWEFMIHNASGSSGSEPIGEAVVCLAGLVLLLALWGWLFVKSLRAASAAKKTPAKKRGQRTNPKNSGRFLPVVYAVSAFNTAATLLSCCQLFTGEYVKLLLFANASFVFYLLFRQEPLLRIGLNALRQVYEDGGHGEIS